MTLLINTRWLESEDAAALTDTEFRDLIMEKLTQVRDRTLEPDESFKAHYPPLRAKRNRAAVWNRFKGVCYLCGNDVSRDAFHIEHVVPLARGGTDTDDNLNIAHAGCNTRKGARLLTDLDWYTG